MIARKRKESDNEMETKKIMATFALLMIVLSVVGFTYATWSDKVTITGTAKMGDLILGFMDETCYENEFSGIIPAAIETHFGITYPSVEKDVATCTVELTEPKSSVHHTPAVTVYKKMAITVEKAYPSLWVIVVVNLKNAGTTPIHITDVTVTPPTGLTYVDDAFEDALGVPIINFWVCKASATTPPTWELLTQPLKSNQIDPCECLWMLVALHFKEEAEPCHTYDFTVEISGVQWNKA